MKWMRAALLLLNLISIALFFLSTLSTTTPPENLGFLSLTGLLFPVLLLINLFFVFVWMALLDWFVVLPVFALAISWNTISNTFNIPVKNQNEGGLKIMSWNVKNFDLYNWSKNAHTRNKMMDEIRKENPDIICFQEFYSDNNILFNNIGYLKDTLGYPYHDFLVTATVDKHLQKIKSTIHQKWGIAVFSKFPLTKSGHLKFANSRHNSAMFTELQTETGRIRLYNIHLQSVQLGYNDYYTLEQMEKEHNTSWSSLKSIFGKLNIAFHKRSDQAREVSEWIAKHPGPKIVCGDFNDSPASFTYTTIAGDFYDPFRDFGKGFGSTYAGLFGLFRIDYILFPSGLNVNSYKVIRKDLSDHYPVVSTFGMH